jgi:hypothetical protein
MSFEEQDLTIVEVDEEEVVPPEAVDDAAGEADPEAADAGEVEDANAAEEPAASASELAEPPREEVPPESHVPPPPPPVGEEPEGEPSNSGEDGGFGNFTQENSQYNIFFGPTREQAQRPEDEHSLVELATRLPERIPTYAAFVAEGVQSNLGSLRIDGVVFISCADEEIALDAAYALVEGLGLPRATQRLVLDFKRAAREGGLPDIFFIKKEGDTTDDVAVVVDAVGEEARPFLDSLIFAGRASAETIRDDLLRSRVFLICLVDASYLEDRMKAARAEQRRARELRFAHWQIAFLRPLLTRHFPSDHERLERQIEEQRRRGWWSNDENDFCDELKAHIRTGRLPDVVSSREGEPDPEPPDTLFRGDASLRDVALYVATFFQNLNPHEFNRLVAQLLDKEADGDGDLKLRWRKSADNVLSDCYLVNVSLAGEATAVGFDNFRRRDALLDYLERRYSLYLDNQFGRVMGLRLLFHPSRRIGEGAMRLVVKAASSYPEDYDGAWLAEQVAAEPPEGANPGKARRLAYARTAELMRRMFETRGLEEVVDSCLQQLLQTRNFRHALEVVKRLHFVPDFNAFKWLRQLVERGDEETRGQVYSYLFGYLRKVRGRVYEVLRALEPWVPEPGRAVLSEANKFTFILLLDYCRWTGRGLDLKTYGTWSSQHPLFVFKEREGAEADLDLLARWLFHPCAKAIFNEPRINSHVEKWVLLLLQSVDGGDALDEAMDGAAVCDVLLGKVAVNAGATQQQSLLDYWAGTRLYLLDKIRSAPRGSAERRAFDRQREVLGEAITRFKAVRAGGAP